MKDENSKILLGKHYSAPIKEIPFEYLFWLFPKLKRNIKETELFATILRFFLTKDITFIDRFEEGTGYCFYFNDFKKYEPGSGEEIPFLKSFWRGKDANDEYNYEIDNVNTKIFIHQINQKWAINYNIVYHYYIFGGYPMVYQKNPDYYFYDGYGKIIDGAFLMRKPWIPDKEVLNNFSKNIKK